MKMEGVCCLFPGKSVFRQQVYVFFSKSQAAGKFLYHAATQVFPFIARYRNNTYSRIRPAGFHQFCQRTYGSKEKRARTADGSVSDSFRYSRKAYNVSDPEQSIPSKDNSTAGTYTP